MNHGLPSSGILRGLRSSDFLSKHGEIVGPAYQPDKKTAQARGDGFQETSINWHTCDDALNLMWRNKGQTAFGVAQVADLAAVIECVERTPNNKEAFSYEKAELHNNPYHGNLLFTTEEKKQHAVRAIAAVLALHSVLITK